MVLDYVRSQSNTVQLIGKFAFPLRGSDRAKRERERAGATWCMPPVAQSPHAVVSSVCFCTWNLSWVRLAGKFVFNMLSDFIPLFRRYLRFGSISNAMLSTKDCTAFQAARYDTVFCIWFSSSFFFRCRCMRSIKSCAESTTASWTRATHSRNDKSICKCAEMNVRAKNKKNDWQNS